MPVSYGTAGRKTLRYVLTYADGSQFTTYSSLYVTHATCPSCRSALPTVLPCRIESLTSTIPLLGSPGQAEVSYYYSTNSTKICGNNAVQPLTKPIIVVDGIDYSGERRGKDIFNDALYYLDKNVQDQNLGFELRDAGYDVVILDFPNVEVPVQIGPFVYFTITRHSGADYMERNAYSLVTLIQQLNQQLQASGSAEKLVVIGPSMGGQVARYALTYMEHNNLPHNTRLFLSLDSPHNGANVPIGLQHFVDYFADISGDQTVVDGLAELNSPASRELVQHHHSQGTLFQADPLRTSFMGSLNNMGSYPGQLRRVAVANGSLDNTQQTDQNRQLVRAGEQAFGLEQRGIPSGGFVGTLVRINWPLGLLARAITLSAGRVYYAPGYGQTQTVLESYYFLRGRHTQEATGPAGSCGLDGAPGGFRYFFDFAESKGPGLFQYQHFYSVRDKACFIPTLSSLGYTAAGPGDNCQAIPELVCTGNTPFDAYYGPTGHNEEHVQLTPGNIEFIRNEILLKTPTPSFLALPNAVCPGGAPVTFGVKFECTPANRPGWPAPVTTYTWTLGPGLVLVSGQGTAYVQLQAVPGFSGTTTIQVVATRAGYAPSAAVLRNVRVGAPELPILRGDPDNSDYCRRKAGFIIANYDPSQHYTLSGGPPVTPLGKFSIKGLWVHPFTLTVGNDCGTVSLTDTVFFEPCGNRTYAAYPNPADNTVTITQSTNNSDDLNEPEDGETPPARPPGPDGAPLFTVRLYDTYGTLRLTQSASKPTVELPTSELPAGLYNVIIEVEGTIVERRHLQISH
ncbi:MAG: T9SS type A sorting domain-containing protein [Janthinobacterium lividum]